MANNNGTTNKSNSTGYIVTNQYGNRFLGNRAYAASTADIYRGIGNAVIFTSRRQAQSCASNINRRGYEDVNAPLKVIPVQMIK